MGCPQSCWSSGQNALLLSGRASEPGLGGWEDSHRKCEGCREPLKRAVRTGQEGHHSCRNTRAQSRCHSVSAGSNQGSRTSTTQAGRGRYSRNWLMGLWGWLSKSEIHSRTERVARTGRNLIMALGQQENPHICVFNPRCWIVLFHLGKN